MGLKMGDNFYNDGLLFECQKCSRCCRYEPGYVFLSHKDLTGLERALNVNKEEIIRKYCRVVDTGNSKRISLLEKSNMDCIFWEPSGCSIYDYRPFQCRSFPFWSNILNTPEDWAKAGETCPGIGKGNLHSKEAIEEWLNGRMNEPFIAL